jgi:periplasmic protein TonB
MIPLIRHYAALWAIPIAFTSTLHLGLAWGALELGFGPPSYTPPDFPVELVTLAAEVPEPVPPPRPVVPPPPRMAPAPKPKPRRPEPIETATSRLPAEPTRPPESTATANPPMTMVEETATPPEPKIPERQATSPSAVEMPRLAERPSRAEKEAAPPANETRTVLEARATAPGPGPGRAADVNALNTAPAAPAPGPPAPRMAAAPPNGTGSELGRIARPRGGYQVLPTYPSTARRLGIQGTALLRVLVLDDGRVGEIEVQKSAGHPDLDRAASDAVKRWRFDPARKGSENVSTWVLLPVEFRLTQ